ncbi:MAG: hypothetical protein J7L75_04310, partial [Thermoproteales archaeon]|nr:hypothetical protein [Thermoproteales archaeon]
VIIYLISWIRRNVIVVDEHSIGWLPVQAKTKKPYSWATARCLLSLACFRSSIAGYDKLVKPEIERPLQIKIARKWKIVDKKTFSVSLLFYAFAISVLYFVLLRASIKELFAPFELKNAGNILKSFIFISFPIILLWAFSIIFMKRGRIDILRIFLKVGKKVKGWII